MWWCLEGFVDWPPHTGTSKVPQDRPAEVSEGVSFDHAQHLRA